jgi:hypothetical protein
MAVVLRTKVGGIPRIPAQAGALPRPAKYAVEGLSDALAA